LSRPRSRAFRQISRLPLTDAAWLYSRAACDDDPTQGWKLHVSATILSAEKVLKRALPVLRRHDALFKIPRDLDQLMSLNAGLSDFSQVGKFITVYPRSDDEAVILARALHSATRGLAGPRVPFDAPYRRNSLVSYRYGVFRSAIGKGRGILRRPDGKSIADRRPPGRAVPSWIADPFHKRRKEARPRRGPIGVDYLAFKTKMQRGKGGVYEAIDLTVSPPRLIIIKEGRRHGETDREGKDGSARIQHEAKVLRRLHVAGVPVPELFREFSQNGNRYLVLEKVPGRPLLPPKRVQPRKISWRRSAQILETLQPILSQVHAARWVWRDCKPSHVIIDRGRLRLIDFENACRSDEERASSWGSRDYQPPSAMNRPRASGHGEDDFALGVIAFQFGTGRFPPSNTRARWRLYKRTNCPERLREEIEALLGRAISRREISTAAQVAARK
jgi:hypothetical protein